MARHPSSPPRLLPLLEPLEPRHFLSASILATSDGAIWSNPIADQIDRLSPSGQLTQYTLPAHTQSYYSGYFGMQDTSGRLAADSQNNIWFIAGNRFARLIPTGDIAYFPMNLSLFTTPYNSFSIGVLNPNFITDATGNLWYSSDSQRDAILRVTPTGTITTFTLPNSLTSSPLVLGPDGNLYFTSFHLTTDPNAPSALASGNRVNVDPSLSYLSRLTPDGTFSETPLATLGLFPRNSLTLDSNGNFWTILDTPYISYHDPSPAPAAAALARITPNGQVTRFSFPVQSDLQSLTADAHGNLWTFDGAYSLLQISPTGQTTRHPLGNQIYANSGYGVTDLAITPQGDLWTNVTNENPVSPYLGLDILHLSPANLPSFTPLGQISNNVLGSADPGPTLLLSPSNPLFLNFTFHFDTHLLPTTPTVTLDFIIDWGDGTSSPASIVNAPAPPSPYVPPYWNNTVNASHTYDTPGLYTVTYHLKVLWHDPTNTLPDQLVPGIVNSASQTLVVLSNDTSSLPSDPNAPTLTVTPLDLQRDITNVNSITIATVASTQHNTTNGWFNMGSGPEFDAILLLDDGRQLHLYDVGGDAATLDDPTNIVFSSNSANLPVGIHPITLVVFQWQRDPAAGPDKIIASAIVHTTITITDSNAPILPPAPPPVDTPPITVPPVTLPPLSVPCPLYAPLPASPNDFLTWTEAQRTRLRPTAPSTLALLPLSRTTPILLPIASTT